MSIDAILTTTRYKGRSRPGDLQGEIEPPEDTTPEPLLRVSYNQTSGPFTDAILGNSGVITGSVERAVAVAGEGISTGSSRDIALDGSPSNFITFAHIPQYQVPRWGFSCYIQPDTLPTAGGKRTIYAKTILGQQGRWTLQLKDDSGTCRILWALGGTFVGGSTGVGVVTAGVATRICLSYDGTNARLFQDDGAAIATTAIANGSMEGNTADLLAGQTPGGIDPYDGVLGDTNLYDYNIDQTFVEALDDARSIFHDPGGGGGEPIPPASLTCLSRPTGTLVDVNITLAPTAVYNLANAPNNRYDCRDLIKTVSLSSGVWPDQGRGLIQANNVASIQGACVSGGRMRCTNITPNFPNWDSEYQSQNHPRGAVFIRNTNAAGLLLEGIRVHGNHDPILFGEGVTGPCTIRWCALTMSRDDAIENDNEVSLTIENCLIESFVIISNRGASNNPTRVTTMQGNISYLLPCRFHGTADTTHIIFKSDSGGSRYILQDEVWAAKSFGSTGSGSTAGEIFRDIVSKIDHIENCRFLWLGSGSNPFTIMPPNTTVISGAEALTELQNRVNAWWAASPVSRIPSFDPYMPGTTTG